MKVLLFGASGQLGRALVATLPSNVDLVALDRSDCDITNARQIAALIADNRPSWIINAAAYTAVDKAESELAVATAVNATAPGFVAQAAEAIGGRMLHVSTDFVFPGNVTKPLAPDDAVGPLSAYGRTKLAGEKAVLAANSRALVVRTAWIYDAYGMNFVRTMLRLMNERGRVRVVADQIGTPTFAPSLAADLWQLVARHASGMWHLTDSGVASWYDFAVAIAEEATALGLLTALPQVEPINSDDYPTPARRPAYGLLDKSASWTLLGRSAPHWRANLRVCLQELKTNG